MNDIFKPEATVSEMVEEGYKLFSMNQIKDMLPHYIDGLKRVQRRIFICLVNEKDEIKVDALMGTIIAQYHPHGKRGLEDAITRLGQSYNTVLPYLDATGIGLYSQDRAAAGRYLDVRPSNFLKDIYFSTHTILKMIPGEVGKGKTEPAFLVPALPMALLNFNSGIATGYASNTPTLNLISVCDLVIEYFKLRNERPLDINKDAVKRTLTQYCLPDLPIYGLIRNSKQTYSAYKDFEFNYVMTYDGVMDITPNRIIVRSLPPYIKPEKIKNALKLSINTGGPLAKYVQYVEDLADKDTPTDQAYMVFELKRGVDPFDALETIKQQCKFTYTFVPQWNFSDDDGLFINANPLQLLSMWAEKICDAKFVDLNNDQRKDTIRLRQLEALQKIINHTDEVIAIIRKAENKEEAEHELSMVYNLTPTQSRFLTDQPLHSLSKQTPHAIKKEYESILQKISDRKVYYKDISKLVVEKIEDIKKTYGYKIKRKSRVPDFLGMVRTAKGVIQFWSFEELNKLLTHWGDGIKEIELYGSDKLYKVYGKDGKTIDEGRLDLPKEFSCDAYFSASYPLTKFVVRNDDNEVIGYQSRLDRSFWEAAATKDRYGLNCIHPFVKNAVHITNRGVVSVKALKPEQFRKTIAAKGRNAESYVFHGSLHYQELTKDQEFIVVCGCTEQPNTLYVQKVKNRSALFWPLCGDLLVIGVYPLDQRIAFIVPDALLNRCVNRAIVLPEAFHYLNNKCERMIIALNKREGVNSLAQATDSLTLNNSITPLFKQGNLYTPTSLVKYL